MADQRICGQCNRAIILLTRRSLNAELPSVVGMARTPRRTGGSQCPPTPTAICSSDCRAPERNDHSRSTRRRVREAPGRGRRAGRSLTTWWISELLTPARRALLDALATEHIAAHGGDPEASLASSRSPTCDTLVRLAGAGVESSLARVGTARRGDTGGLRSRRWVPKWCWRRVHSVCCRRP